MGEYRRHLWIKHRISVVIDFLWVRTVRFKYFSLYSPEHHFGIFGLFDRKSLCNGYVHLRVYKLPLVIIVAPLKLYIEWANRDWDSKYVTVIVLVFDRYTQVT